MNKRIVPLTQCEFCLIPLPADEIFLSWLRSLTAKPHEMRWTRIEDREEYTRINQRNKDIYRLAVSLLKQLEA